MSKQKKNKAGDAPAWFQQNHPQTPLTCIAYFSMEFITARVIPHYDGIAVPLEASQILWQAR